jgi:hypothetical protein
VGFWQCLDKCAAFDRHLHGFWSLGINSMAKRPNWHAAGVASKSFAPEIVSVA